MEKNIQVLDLSFSPMISQTTIQDKIKEVANQLKKDFGDKRPLLLGVLNGAFIFAADLMRACDFDCEISFIKLSSYDGTTSTGNLNTVIGLNEDIADRHIIIVEDIVDTGRTMHSLIPDLKKLSPASVSLVALLVKPEAMEKPVQIDYTCFEIPPAFVVGYGLDYNGFGRNLPDIYQLAK